MPIKKDKRVDLYIANSREFASPILRYLREIVHQACPDCQETIKWGFPHFEYKGLLCSMAAFKEHCTFGFWKARLVMDITYTASKEAMGQLGRITQRKAMEMNEKGIRVEERGRERKGSKDLTVPDYIHDAIKRNKKAAATFKSFPYTHKKEYVEWVTEAKTEETRNRRLETAVEWLSQGKKRNWKYEKK
jgi:uncharacterized protein YdeI (YjbR/CyaY-like superfamily)